MPSLKVADGCNRGDGDSFA